MAKNKTISEDGVKKTRAKRKTTPKVEKKIKGTITHWSDGTLDFKPNAEAGEALYNDTKSETKHGTVKASDKSLVMRVSAQLSSADPVAELRRNTAELLDKIAAPDAATEVSLMPENEYIGKAGHSDVYLCKDGVTVVTRIGLNEPNPKVAQIVAHATPEQLRYIQQYIEPDAVFQSEMAQVCIMVREAKKKSLAVSVNKKNNKNCK